MKPRSLFCFATFALISVTTSFALQGVGSPYTDSDGDIDPGIATGGGTLDILGMEVSNTLTDVTFTLTVGGDIGSTDWGNFLLGISTGSTAIVNTGNGWNRPMQLNSPLGGMDYWVGSWVNGGGGAQLWDFDGVSWNGPNALAGFSFVAGTTSTITYTATLASLGLGVGQTFYFDAYTSGGGGTDGAVDSLANPNISITAWDQTYTSKTTQSGGPGLNSYTVTAIPEPATSAALLGFAILAALGLRRRPRG
jgi:hypothetical protein